MRGGSKKEKGGVKSRPSPDKLNHLPVYLDRTELRIAAAQELPWAKEILNEIALADRWLDEIETWSIVEHFPYAKPVPRTDIRCPICYDFVYLHNLERCIRCSARYYERRDCDHDWADDFMGGSICRKCSLTS